MRDPERIDRIVDLLREAWKANPDWRLGQLVSNSIGLGQQDVFHREDDALEAGLRRLLRGSVDAPVDAIPAPKP